MTNAIALPVETITSLEKVWDALQYPDGTPRDLIVNDAILIIHQHMVTLAAENTQLSAALEAATAAAQEMRDQRDDIARELQYTARRITGITRDEIAHFVNYEMLNGNYGDEVAEDLLRVLIGEDTDSVSFRTIHKIKQALETAAEEIADLYELPQRDEKDDDDE